MPRRLGRAVGAVAGPLGLGGLASAGRFPGAFGGAQVADPNAEPEPIAFFASGCREVPTREKNTNFSIFK